MKRTILTVPLTALLFGGVAYALGRSSGGQRQARRRPLVSAPRLTASPALRKHIEGAGHAHARTRPIAPVGQRGGLYQHRRQATWTPVEVSGDVDSTDFMSLLGAPREAKAIFAGGHGLGGVQSSDRAATWARADQGIDRTDIHGLTINQRYPDYLYAYPFGQGVYRSDDGGPTWHRLEDGAENPAARSIAYMAVETDTDRSMGAENWGLPLTSTADGCTTPTAASAAGVIPATRPSIAVGGFPHTVSGSGCDRAQCGLPKRRRRVRLALAELIGTENDVQTVAYCFPYWVRRDDVDDARDRQRTSQHVGRPPTGDLRASGGDRTSGSRTAPGEAEPERGQHG